MPIEVQCSNCHQAYPEVDVFYRCPKCGGIFDYIAGLSYDPSRIDNRDRSIWRYRSTFGLPENAPLVSLGEGNTPYLETTYVSPQGDKYSIGLKCEYLNPTGSFKDRGSATIASFLLSRGIEKVLEDSSGNAGASLAAYAARCGMQACIYTPEAASGLKRKQIEAYGAELISIPGPRSNTSQAVKNAAEEFAPADRSAYASHAYLPFNLPGYATIAYELLAQMGELSGTILCPVGQGGLILGLARGLQALREVGQIHDMPVLVGVQAESCAPLWALTTYGAAGLSMVTEGDTLAEGIRIRYPLRGDVVVQTLRDMRGFFVAVGEAEIRLAWAELAGKGFNVEPTSAVVWAALPQIVDRLTPPYTLILTGSGFKFRE
jgi:threonine synthase